MSGFMKLLVLVFLLFAILSTAAIYFPKGKSTEVVSSEAAIADRNRAKVGPADLELFLAPYQQALDRSRRPVVRIGLDRFAEDALTASKLGGRAWWPEGEAEPKGEGDAQMTLLAQINFSEVPAMAGYPSKGLLQFFVAATDLYGANVDDKLTLEQLSEQRNFRVVYWPDLSRRARSIALVTSDMLPHRADAPRRMRFTLDREMLSSSDYRFDALVGGQSYEAAEDFAHEHKLDGDAFYEALWDRFDGSGHKLGGYPYFTQTDPRPGGNLELLLQLDSDEEMMWGDAGVANFFISPTDLARADFSHVVYNWDCH
jgi:uncharacterized protein YwqG